MKVYILKGEDVGGEYLEGVFASFSAMLIWLKETYDFESDFMFYKDYPDGGYFVDKPNSELPNYSLHFEAHELIGVHDVRTDKVVFKDYKFD